MATLRDLVAACGADRAAAACRELTKLHESIVRGSLGELASASESGSIPARGEFVLIVGSVEAAHVADAPDAADAVARGRDEVEQLVSAGVARGEAARRVSAQTGIPRRRLYGEPGKLEPGGVGGEVDAAGSVE